MVGSTVRGTTQRKCQLFLEARRKSPHQISLDSSAHTPYAIGTSDCLIKVQEGVKVNRIRLSVSADMPVG